MYSIANYDWTPSESRHRPSGYIDDLLTYLRDALSTLISLPVIDIANNIYNCIYESYLILFPKTTFWIILSIEQCSYFCVYIIL